MSTRAESADPPTRVRLDLAYDGGSFHGWARQPGLRTVQGLVEEGLARLFERSGDPAPTLTVAGRTDVGVHATAQVAHVDLTPAQLALLERGRPDPEHEDARGVPSLARRLGGVLARDPDVRIRAAALAPAGFDARFSAVWRRYEYRIADAEAAKDPRRRGHTLWVPRALDPVAMDQAARSLLGLHDFAAFCKPREGATTIRTLQAFAWIRDEDGVLVARLQADAFCHSMVRALVGACLATGEGRLGAEDPIRLREEGERTSAFSVLPAHGLTLTEVGYPEDSELAERAERTRARRDLDGVGDAAV